MLRTHFKVLQFAMWLVALAIKELTITCGGLFFLERPRIHTVEMYSLWNLSAPAVSCIFFLSMAESS
jgi:hypothetical protein